MKKAQCKKCGEFKEKIIIPVTKNYSRYLDSNGNFWNGRICPSCRVVESRMLQRRVYGVKSRDEVTHLQNKKGRDNEWLVFNLLKSRGFDVEINETRGPDLMIFKNNKFIGDCEVKTVSSIKRITRKHKEFFTGPLHETGRKSKFMAYVFPDKGTYICEMKEHLNECSPCGMRHFNFKKNEHLIRGSCL